MAKGKGPTVAKAFVAIIPETDGAQEKITKGIVPATEKAAEEAGEEGGESLAGKLGSALKGAAGKVASAAKIAAGAGVAALGALTTAAYGAYSEFEQLEGGVQTIFGDKTAQTILQNSRAAFASVQMSSRDYLDTITSFSASLIQSLGGDTDAAASLADVAISDMADNANKMGTSIDSIRYAYQGFARGTYTMLDNLKLGYGGTQDEMLRLVHDAGVVDASITSINDVSFDQIIESIHVIQDRMGIAGASAAEAASTLEGSANMAAAAWDNMLVAIGSGDDGQIQAAADAMMQSITAVLENALPRIAIIVSSIIENLPAIAQTIIDALPDIMDKVGAALQNVVANSGIPEFVDGFTAELMQNNVVQSIVAFAGRVADAFGAAFGDIDAGAVLQDMQTALQGILDWIGQVAAAAGEAIAWGLDQIDTETIITIFETLRAAGTEAWSLLSQAFATAGDIMQNVVIPLLSGIWDIIQNNIMPALAAAWVAIQPAIAAIGDFLVTVWEGEMKLASAISEFIKPALEALFAFLSPVLDTIMGWVVEISKTVGQKATEIWEKAKPVIEGIYNLASALFTWIGKFLEDHKAEVEAVMKFVGTIVSTLFDTIGARVRNVIDAIGTTISGIVDVIRGIFDMAVGIITGDFDRVKAGADTLVNGIANVFKGIVDFITAPFRAAFTAVKKLWNSTLGGMNFTIPDWVPGIGGSSFGIPKLAAGGTITAGGTVIVGEAGPELLTLPRGARVSPLDGASATTPGDSYQVIVGDVDLTDMDAVKRATREYLEFLAKMAQPARA